MLHEQHAGLDGRGHGPGGVVVRREPRLGVGLGERLGHDGADDHPVGQRRAAGGRGGEELVHPGEAGGRQLGERAGAGKEGLDARALVGRQVGVEVAQPVVEAPRAGLVAQQGDQRPSGRSAGRAQWPRPAAERASARATSQPATSRRWTIWSSSSTRRRTRSRSSSSACSTMPSGSCTTMTPAVPARVDAPGLGGVVVDVQVDDPGRLGQRAGVAVQREERLAAVGPGAGAAAARSTPRGERRGERASRRGPAPTRRACRGPRGRGRTSRRTLRSRRIPRSRSRAGRARRQPQARSQARTSS